MFPNVKSNKAVMALLSPYLQQMSSTELDPTDHKILFNFRLAGHSVDDVKDPGKTIVFYESEPSGGGRFVSFADDHARFLSTGLWDAAEALMNDPLSKGSKASRTFSPGYQAALSALYDRLMAGDKYSKPKLTAGDLKLVNPDFATGEPAREKSK